MSADSSPSSRSYRPWGRMRRKNLLSRIVYGMVMTAAGLALVAALILAAVFAASLLVVGAAAIAVMALAAVLRRKPVRIFVRAQDPKGVMEARRDGSTWTVY